MHHEHVLLITLVVAIAAGMSFIVIADKLKIPSIILLLLGGIALGPEVSGTIDPSSMSYGLRVLVALAVGLILFEGALSLDFRALKTSPHAIRGLLGVGSLITWGGCSLMIYFIAGVPGDIAILSGSLIIVTGPTVIAPLLQRVKVKQPLAHILHWEGVLIDPIGVFIALLCFEWIAREGSALGHIGALLLRIFIGTAIGLIGGYLLEEVIRRKLIHRSLQNIFIFSSAILLFGISDILITESGILTVVVAGAWLSYRINEEIKDTIHFHEEVVRLIIGVLFVLLSANLKLSGFLDLGWAGVLTLLSILLIVRPANVFLSTIKDPITVRDKLFLSWLNPRGIVAASMASLFALRLSQTDNEYAWFLESFTFFVIITTVLVHGLFTKPMAKLLKVEAEPATDWLVVGSNPLAYAIARFLQSAGLTVSMVDRRMNYDLYRESDKFELIAANIYEINPLHDARFSKIGYVLGATTNRDMNMLIAQIWGEKAVEPENTMFLTTEFTAQEGVPIIIQGESLEQISIDLLRGDLSVLTRQVDRNMDLKTIFQKSGELMLMRVKDKVQPPNMAYLDQASDLLFLVKHTKPFTYYLHTDFIFTDLPSSDIVSFLLSCSERIAQNLREIGTDELSMELLKTEPLLSSYIGNGIAVPRVFSPTIWDVICSVLIVPEGVDYIPSSSKHKANIIFFVIGPESQSHIISDLLSKINTVRNKPEVLKRLLNSSSPNDIYIILHEATKETY